MTALCHPERPLLAKGLCTQCYQNWNVRKHLHPHLEVFVERWIEKKAQRALETGLRRKAKPKPPSIKAYLKRYWLKSRYGLTEEDYQQMLQQQGGVCAICSTPPKGEGKQGLYVDHNHTTGDVRKLLCPSCNTLVGNVERQPDLLNKVQNYLTTDLWRNPYP